MRKLFAMSGPEFRRAQMVSLHNSVPESHLIATQRRPFAGVRTISLLIIPGRRRHLQAVVNSRFEKNEVLLVKHKRGAASASNPNSSEELQETKTVATSGPPFLTILAGVIVFLLICWIIGSMVLWIVGLIVHPPQPK